MRGGKLQDFQIGKDLYFMNTFEQEYTQLVDWMRNKNKEYEEKLKNHVVKGHDSELGYDRRQDVKEYNRRLSELKKKYGKETATQEPPPQDSFRFASGK